MQAKQGLWAAVGAGTALAAAGLLVLVSVSVVLAVHGWPQVSKASKNFHKAMRREVTDVDELVHHFTVWQLYSQVNNDKDKPRADVLKATSINKS